MAVFLQWGKALSYLLDNTMSREMILKEYIDHLGSEYSYILIDCMPSLGITTIPAIIRDMTDDEAIVKMVDSTLFLQFSG